MGKMKQQYIELRGIEDYPLEEQIYQIFIGKGLRTTYGNRIDLRELAEEMVFALDFVNGDNANQPIILNTLPDITGEDGVPAIDLVKYFGLDDYIVESVLNG
jgi:hypothetical protein